jgi:uncharacterized protein
VRPGPLRAAVDVAASSAPAIALTPTPAAPGRVWLVLGDKPGDNAQVEAVVEALGWDCERKTLQWRAPYATAKPRFRVTLDHVEAARSAALEPPWPDLVLTIGRRPSMAALWVKERSGGRTRLVLFGKPSGLMDRFDLVVAGAEVQLPPRSNLVPIRLPLTRAKDADIEAAIARWQPRLAPLPRPLIAILVGGPTMPFVFDDEVANRLGALARKIADAGGTPYVTTSRRTPPNFVEILRLRLPPGARLFAWAQEVDNPYLGLLGLADGFIVTGDSVSMMAEVVRARKPLAILDLPLGRFGALDQWRRALTRRLFGTRGGLGRLAPLLGATRDFRAFHQTLLDQGLAVWASEPLLPPHGAVPDDLAAVVARINALIVARTPA